jgi:hypothetical protein
MRYKVLATSIALAIMVGSFVRPAVMQVTTALAQGVPSTAQDAVQLLRNYYRWINARKYDGAFGVWEKRDDGNAANGQSFTQFKNGFRDTRSVSAVVGTPGEIGGAAGSNFVEVPVDISAVTNTGKKQKFVGTYTFRSSNVADDKSWYIYAAKVKQVK